ncbi:glycosyltransferase family 2 protein [Georgenia ruanii]|uniref:Glycosyltransferase n=1 Tax=Georgenia ruanii TaxID=348442 RepID=A0A7J9UTN3_9MICO|nr:glycosyltransferase family 2 protein [Georgenia ruanii]MPV87673.1 glycosyltransferase [Georgenia ruanii]
MTIDIMLPYYGDVAMMKAAVSSVLAQDDGDFRLTVIDDAYPDPAVPEYFAGLAAEDPRVVYLRNDTNLGANANYRKCVALVEHPITVIMGADDVMLPGYLTTVRSAFDDADVSLVQPGVEVIDENGDVYAPLGDRVKAWVRRRAVGRSSRAVVAGEAAAASLMSANWLYFPSVAWRSAELKTHPFRREYDVVQDLALAIDVVRSGGKIAVLEDVCFRYRRHRQSDSAVRAVDGRRFAEEHRLFAAYAEEFQRLGWSHAARAARLHGSSRLHALTLLPQALSTRQWRGLRALVSHAVLP